MQGTLDLNYRATDPDTSRDAAAAHPDIRRTDRDRAYDALKAFGADGATDFELGDAIGRIATSAGKRRLELCRLGLVVDAGVRRPSPSGSPAIVWKIVT